LRCDITGIDQGPSQLEAYRELLAAEADATE
jgi:hypothetical protein